MPVPSSPTGFSVTQTVTGDPQLTIAWSQVGTPSHFDIERRRTGSTKWLRHRLAPSSVFGAASPFSWTTVGPFGNDWRISAVNNLGRSSAPATTTPSILIEGAWLLPFKGGSLQTARKVFIGAESTPWVRPVVTNAFEPLGRSSKIVQHAGVYAEEGSISGQLVTAYSQSPDTWRERLETLVIAQRDYRVWLITPHLALSNVSITSLSISPWLEPNNYDCEFEYIQGGA